MSRSACIAAATDVVVQCAGLPPPVILAAYALLDQCNALPGGAVRPALLRVPINLSRFVCFFLHHHGTNYQRNMNHVCLTAGTFAIQIECSRLTSGSVQPFAYPQYGLFFGDQNNEGVELARWNRPLSTSSAGTINGSLGSLPDGRPYLLRLVAYDATGARVVSPLETLIPFGVWVDRNGTAKDHPLAFVQNGSWGWLHGEVDYLFTMFPKTLLKDYVAPLDFHYVPTVDQPVNQVVPHTFYGGEPFNTAPVMLDSNRRPLANAPMRLTRMNFARTTDNGQMRTGRPSITARGITVTENNQAYSVFDFFDNYPSQPYTDGPWGVGYVANITALHVGHAGSVYFCDPFSFGRINTRGEVKRFAGMRQKYRRYWGDMHPPANGDPWDSSHIEIAGNWAANIPMNRRWVKECWGLAPYLPSLALDLSLPRIVDPRPTMAHFGPLPQHAGNPIFFTSDAFNRVLKHEFDKNNPNAEPYITEFITGLADPWQIRINGNKIFISEREDNTISVWSADTPQTWIEDLMPRKSNTLGVVDPTLRKWVKNAGVTRAQILAEQCVGPEGLVLESNAQGEVIATWGALAQAQARWINATTKEWGIAIGEVPYIVGDGSGQPHFVHLARSDGTLGPEGMLMTSTADNQTLGRPLAHLPVPGTVIPTGGSAVLVTHSKKWSWAGLCSNALRGPAAWSDSIYPLASDIGNGMLALGNSNAGCDVYIKSTLGEALPDEARLARGKKYYMDQGYGLLFDQFAQSWLDLPPPFGENTDLDYTLEAWGRTRP